MAGREAESSSVAAVNSCSASSQVPRHMQMEAYWVRHTANNGRRPHLAQNALSRVHPLNRALVVADAIAGRNHVTARQADRHQIVHLAGDHCRVHFIQRSQSLRDGAGGHERQPLHARARAFRGRGCRPLSRHECTLTRARTPDRDRPLRGVPTRPHGFRARPSRPNPIGPRAAVVRAAAIRSRPRFHRETPSSPTPANRNPRGIALIASFEKQPVRAFPRVEHDVREIEPPRGHAQPFQRLGTLMHRQHGFVGLTRVGPRTRGERLVSGVAIERSVSRGHCINRVT